ncbi:putative WRKY transcription factor 70, partial [Mucuna pruriens]
MQIMSILVKILNKMKRMVCGESESVSGKKKRLIMKELVKGQEAATQLKLLLQNPFGSEVSLSSQELMTIVLTSFTQALSIITSSSLEPSSAHDLTHRTLLNASPVATSGNDPSSDGGNRSRKAGRGRYNRRRSALAWTIVSCATDDNHAWRKYGQKRIQNSEFPRCYFRCSHKYDQGCRATKQVQRDEENPNMYQTTYIGIHTCNASSTDSTDWESYLVNSDRDSNLPNLQDRHIISSPSLTIKQQFPKEETPTDVIDHKLDPNLWSDLNDFQPSKPTTMPLQMESDNADNEYSYTDSQCLLMDFGVASVHFGTDFHFDQSQLF